MEDLSNITKELKGSNLLFVSGESATFDEKEKELLEKFNIFFSTFVLFCLIKPSVYKNQFHATLEEKGIDLDDYPNFSTTLRYVLSNIPLPYICLLKKKDLPATFDKDSRHSIKVLIPLDAFPFPITFLNKIEKQMLKIIEQALCGLNPLLFNYRIFVNIISSHDFSVLIEKEKIGDLVNISGQFLPGSKSQTKK